MSIRTCVFASVLVFSGPVLSASYPPQGEDYGDQGDFIIKLGTEFGRTADLMPIGPILANFPENPGSTTVNIDEYRFEDTIWDLSDLRNPTLIGSLTEPGGVGRQPINAHGTIVAFDDTLGPLLWAGDNWWRFDGDAIESIDQIIVEESEAWSPVPLSYPMMFSPYYTRMYWDYGFSSDGLFAIRDTTNFITDTSETEWLGEDQNQYWLGEPFVGWDHLQDTGVTGFASWLGNLLVVASDQQSTGMAIYDVSGFKEGGVPELLSVFDPSLVEPEHEGVINTVGIGGYWMEPYGTNKMVWAARERIEATPSRRHSAMFIVDFTDPRNPFLSCAVYFNQDQGPGSPEDGDGSSDPMYVNFQDNFAYVDHFKVDIEACEAAFADDSEISAEEFSDIVYRFDDIANECDGSQYFRPLGQVGIFGGYDFWETEDANEQGMCFFVTSDEPDTNAPYISGHRPLAGQTDYPIDGFIHLHIPETLRTETVTNAITVTNVDADEEIGFRHILSHTGTISIWPDQDFNINATYRVDVSGIQDYMGNTMEPYSFSFSTGDEIIIVDPPEPPPEEIVPSYSGTPYYPIKSSQLACEPEVDDGNVWVVNPDNDSITIIDRSTDDTSFETTHSLYAEIRLNYETPTSVTKIGSAFAVTHRDDDKVVIYSEFGAPIRAIDTGYGTQPVASVASDGVLYVALYGSGEIISIDSGAWNISNRLTVGPTPKAMAMSGDRLLVTRFISGAEYGEIYDVDVSSGLTLTRIIQANKVLVPDDDDHGAGVPNYLSSIVISEDVSTAYITANKVNIDRGLQRNGEPLDGDNTVRPMIIRLDLVNNRDANEDPNTRQGTLDLDNGADPSGIIFLANPDIRIHTLRGNDVAEANDLAANTSAQFDTGAAPMEMCATLRTLYVKNFADRTVSAIDVAPFMHDGSLNPDIETISTVSQEVLTGQELQGLQLFYASLIPEMGPEGYMSCSTCHFGGGDDGVVWDISNMGEGFRNTISLTGASGTRFGNLHWSANFDEVQDFEIQMEQLNEGEGLLPGITFNGESPLDVQTGNLGVESIALDSLAAYIGSLGKDSVRRSPHRTYTGELTASAQRGRDIFYNDNCEQCHAGSAFRDGETHDVGTIQTTSGSRLGGVLSEIRTPTLIELWESAPYFHDGSAATLADVLTVGDHLRTMSAQDETDLIAFLNSIDREDFIEDNELFVPGTPPEMADLVVTSGDGSGRYAVGSEIDIVADSAPDDEVFIVWTGDVDGVADVNDASTTILLASGGQSVAASFGPDSFAPTAPATLVASDISTTNVLLSWGASSDNVGVTEYAVLVNGSEFGDRTALTSLRIFGLQAGTTYDISVVAYDAVGNVSDESNVESVETLTPSGIDDVSAYFFGHSLIYHTFTDYPNKNEVSTPWWAGQFAAANGQTMSATGEFRTSNYLLPPVAQWSFEGMPTGWDDTQETFAEADFDAVVYTELNFVQDVPPDTLYYDDSGTPISSVVRVLDHVREAEPGITFYIYENWGDAGVIMPNYHPAEGGNDLPTTDQVAAYHAQELGPNSAWWIELHDAVAATHSNVKMIPIGPIISGILTEIPAMAAIPFEDIYEDNAPHGRPTIYFLAGMIQYAAMYQQRPPAGFSVSSVVNDAVDENYETIADYIWDALNDFNFPDGSSRVW